MALIDRNGIKQLRLQMLQKSPTSVSIVSALDRLSPHALDTSLSGMGCTFLLPAEGTTIAASTSAAVFLVYLPS